MSNRRAKILGDNRYFGHYKKLALSLTIGVLVWGGYVALNQFLLPLNTLYVTGNIHNIDKTLLQDVTYDAVETGFFAADLQAIKKNIQDLAWVQSVSVRRVWPNGLHVHIKEHTPVARWGAQQLINEHGKLFLPTRYYDVGDLTVLTGLQGTHFELYQQYIDFQSLLENTGLGVKELIVDERRSMTIVLSNHVKLIMGRVSNVADTDGELRRFLQAYQSTLAVKAEQIEAIDLRYTNGFAVNWKINKAAELKSHHHHKLRS